MKTRFHSGFTLVELLIVVAIIALLAAILFPVFGRARDNARAANCKSNLRQIYLGMRQYAQDYDSMYPDNAALGNSSFRYTNDVYGLPTKLMPYTKSEQIWFCQSAYSGHSEAKIPSYWWTKNSNIMRAPDNAEDGNNTLNILMWENYAYKAPSPLNMIQTSMPTTNAPATWSSGNYCAHSGNKNHNILFFDGHVKLHPWGNVIASRCKTPAVP